LCRAADLAVLPSHEAEITHRYVIEIPALMDNAAWEAEALEHEHEPDKVQ
jgi:hypothetical protein